MHFQFLIFNSVLSRADPDHHLRILCKNMVKTKILNVLSTLSKNYLSTTLSISFTWLHAMMYSCLCAYIKLAVYCMQIFKPTALTAALIDSAPLYTYQGKM